jgi:hypothetical protein
VDADKHIDSLPPASVLVGVAVISAYCWVLREHASVSSLGKNLQVGDRRSYRGGWEHPLAGVCMRFSGCVLFENCTVDASIFVVSN